MSLPLPLVPRAPVPLGGEKGIILALVQLNIEILPRRTDHVTGGVLGGNLVDGDAVNTWGGDGLLRGVESSTEVSGVVRVLIAGASATDGSGGVEGVVSLYTVLCNGREEGEEESGCSLR
jgi:hypothetical protein